MKKQVVTHMFGYNPSINENISTGYDVGQFWRNTTTYQLFYHTSDGRWIDALSDNFSEFGLMGYRVKSIAYDVTPKTGSISYSFWLGSETSIVYGTNNSTQFLTEINIGDKLCNSNGTYIGVVYQIDSDIQLRINNLIFSSNPDGSPEGVYGNDGNYGIATDNTIKLILNSETSNNFSDTYVNSKLYIPTLIGETGYSSMKPAEKSYETIKNGVSEDILSVNYLTGNTYNTASYIYDYTNYVGIDSPDSGDTGLSGNINKLIKISGTNIPAIGSWVYVEDNSKINQHTEGYNNLSAGFASHTEGTYNISSGDFSHSEGLYNNSDGIASHTQGVKNYASGNASSASGSDTKAYGENSFSEGKNTIAAGNASHSQGTDTMAIGDSSFSSGSGSIAEGHNSFSQGIGTKANGSNSASFNSETIANGYASISQGIETVADGSASLAQGDKTFAVGDSSNSRGDGTMAYSKSSTSEGFRSISGVKVFTVLAIETNYILNDINILDGSTIDVFCKGDIFDLGSETSVVFRDHIASAADLYYTSDKSIINSISIQNGGDYSGLLKINIDAPYNYTTIDSMSGKLDIGTYIHVLGDRKGLNDEDLGSHAEGVGTSASGKGGHAEGVGTLANYDASHAEGQNTRANAHASHAEGIASIASGDGSHAEGVYTIASGYSSHSEGIYSVSSGSFSHAEGTYTIASGNYSHAEGNSSVSSGVNSHAEGNSSVASGDAAHAEGVGANADGDYSHAEGGNTIASGSYSHAEGRNTSASGGDGSHAEGSGTSAIGYNSHAEGGSAVAYGNSSHAEGSGTYASGFSSHAEGASTTASNFGSHAEGAGTTASGSYSHAEGYTSIASGHTSHAEGNQTRANGSYSHAEGDNTIASGGVSHAEGSYTVASGSNSHAGGYQTIADKNAMTAIGQFNTANITGALFVVGNGINTNLRSNALVVKDDGSMTLPAYNKNNTLAGFNNNGLIKNISPSGITSSIDISNDLINVKVTNKFSTYIWDGSLSLSQVNNGVAWNDIIDMYISPDGVYFYATDNNADILRRHVLSTPWDLNSIGASQQSISLSSITNTQLRGVYFSPNGLNLYITGFDNSGPYKIIRYTLSTPWDLYTTTFHSQYIAPNDGSLGFMMSIKFSDDGRKMYSSASAEYVTPNVCEYNLSTPWDISTLSYVHTKNFSSEIVNYGCGFNIYDDGKAVLFGNRLDKKIYVYNLTTQWDITSAVYVGKYYNLPISGVNYFNTVFAPSSDKIYVGYSYINVVGISRFDLTYFNPTDIVLSDANGFLMKKGVSIDNINALTNLTGINTGDQNLAPYATLSGSTFTGAISATSITKTGGLSSQFLKADGSVDNNTYLTSSGSTILLGNYLPLTGGTVTGNIILDGALIHKTLTVTGVTNNNVIYSVSNTLGDAAHFDYVVKNEVTNAMRTGTLMAVWDSNGVEFNEIGTNDLNASTTDISFNITNSGGLINIVPTIVGGSWKIKITTRII